MSQIYQGVMSSHREVHPHSRNQNIPSPPSMNPDPVPPVRPLLTHVIADEPLRREAGITHNHTSQNSRYAGSTLQPPPPPTYASKTSARARPSVVVVNLEKHHIADQPHPSVICSAINEGLKTYPDVSLPQGGWHVGTWLSLWALTLLKNFLTPPSYI